MKVTCTDCQKEYEIPNEYAGKKVKCKCGQPLQVPSQADDILLDDNILSDLDSLDIPEPTVEPKITPAPAASKLTTCGDCGQTVSKKASQCPKCGAPNLKQTFTCEDCGSDSPVKQQACVTCGAPNPTSLSQQGTTPVAMAKVRPITTHPNTAQRTNPQMTGTPRVSGQSVNPTLEAAVAGLNTTRKDYYLDAFRAIDANGGKFTPIWNINSFLGGLFIYFHAGMYIKAIAMLLISIALGGVPAIPFWIYCGFAFNYDLYLKKVQNKDLW